ncbi:MAG: hypothetical protein ACLFRP_04045 [Puniceicoccaceae bacterium]
MSRRPASTTRGNLRYSTLDGVFATPWTVLCLPGSFLIVSPDPTGGPSGN